MDVPVIKIKETCPGKSDEKLIKTVVNMVGQAFHCMWHAALPLVVFLYSTYGDWTSIRHKVCFVHSEARCIEMNLYLFLRFGYF